MDAFMPASAPIPGFEILIIEDEAVTAAYITRIIDKIMSNFPESKISVARDMKTAMFTILQHAPDLILLDLSLPDSPWEETLEKRIDAFAERSPLVILTGHSVDSIRKFITECGAVQSKDVEVLSKEQVFVRHGWFFERIFDVVKKWNEKKHGQARKEIRQMLDRAAEINTTLHAANPKRA